MRYLKFTIFALAVLILQTTLLSRMRLLGAVPDLILVSVIIFAIMRERVPATLFSAAMGFIQDLFSAGIYLNVIVKVMVSSITSSIREEFTGDEYSLATTLILVFTPGVLLTESVVLYFLNGQPFHLFYLILKMMVAIVYNQILAALLFPIMQRFFHGE